jgi:hypothetical protein
VRIFGPKREEVIGSQRKLHHNHMKEDGMSRACSRHGRDDTNYTDDVYKFLSGKPKRKRGLLRPSHRQEDNIKIDLYKIGWEGVDWIDLATDGNRCQAFVNTVRFHRRQGID